VNEISLFLTSFHPCLKEDACDPLIRVIKASMMLPHKQETRTRLRNSEEPNSSVQAVLLEKFLEIDWTAPFQKRIPNTTFILCRKGVVYSS